MITRAHRARTLALAFLRNTECKAIPIDLPERVMMSVERLGQRIHFESMPDGDEQDHGPERAGEPIRVRFFAEVQAFLERCRWRPGLLDA